MSSDWNFPVYLNNAHFEPDPEDDIYYLCASNGFWLKKTVNVGEAIVPVDEIPFLLKIKPTNRRNASGKEDLPVYLYEQKEDMPSEDAYIVARNGYFLKKGDNIQPVKKPVFVDSVEFDVSLNIPPVDSYTLAKAHYFFAEVYSKHRAESEVQLYFSEDKGYRLHCPEQTVSGSSVRYSRLDQLDKDELKDWKLVGTIHSHCDFGAFHSGTDVDDEEDLDGIHITLGHVNSTPSISVSFAINGIREKIEPQNACVGLLEKQSLISKAKSRINWSQEKYYNFELNKEDKKNLESDKKVIDEEWMPKVKPLFTRRSNKIFFPNGRRASRKGYSFEALEFGEFEDSSDSDSFDDFCSDEFHQ